MAKGLHHVLMSWGRTFPLWRTCRVLLWGSGVLARKRDSIIAEAETLYAAAAKAAICLNVTGQDGGSSHRPSFYSSITGTVSGVTNVGASPYCHYENWLMYGRGWHSIHFTRFVQTNKWPTSLKALDTRQRSHVSAIVATTPPKAFR